MKTFRALVFVIVTLFQLAPSFQTNCGETRTVQVSDGSRNISKLHFPWAGAIFSLANKTQQGDIKYICGASLLTESHSVTGELYF